MRCLLPESLIGLDFSKNAVEQSNRFNKAPNLKFMEGNAEKLPFEENCFDVVYNVESSHSYGNMDAFISEVVRVLKPGGIFAWSDLRSKEGMEKTHALLMQSRLILLAKENITLQILAALTLISQKKEAAKRKSPSIFSKNL